MSIATPIVFVVDDDPSLRESLQALIRSAGFEPVAFASAEQFLAHPRVLVPSCLVLDVTLPSLNGLELQKRMAADRKDMPIIVITAHIDLRLTVEAMKAGAIEFLTKPLSNDVLLSAIREAIVKSRTIMSYEAQTRALLDRYGSLSCREKQVMALVVSGRLNKLIGSELGISEITVKAHRGKMMRKMQAESLAHLVNIAGRLHIRAVPDTPRRVMVAAPAGASLLRSYGATV